LPRLKNLEEVYMERCRFLNATAVLVVLILLWFSSGAFAENKAEQITLTPFWGGHIFDKDQNLDKYGRTGGLGIGYNLTENWGLEALFNYTTTNAKEIFDINSATTIPKDDAEAWMGRLEAQYNITQISDRLVPFLAVGAGAVKTDSDQLGYDSNTDFLLDYGGGLKLYITPAIALRGDIRHAIVFPKDDANDNDYFSNVLYTVGLMFALGGKEEVKEEVTPPPPPPAPAPVVEVAPPPPPPPPKEEQGAYVFRNIYFDFDKASIKAESEPILDEVSDFLKANPNLKMEIQGHTDSKGTAAYNLKLSDRRAEAVKAYLVKDEAIKPDRLTSKGYGLTKPVATNDTEEGRAKNRRVEFAPIK
jgi:OOP family OmpA-OmpF porin